MVGLFFVCMGCGAVPALMGSGSALIGSEYDQLARGLGHGMLSAGYVALAIFVWRCFGADATWRVAAAAVLSVSLAALLAAQGVVDGFRDGAVIRVTSLVRGIVLAWAFAESLHYRAQLRRRLALGLSDPVVTNRFTLWCLWTGSLLASNMVMISVRWLMDFPTAPASLQAAVVFSMIGFALTAATSLFLAFFPPQRYAENLRRRAVA
jgi:hypothetical protein